MTSFMKTQCLPRRFLSVPPFTCDDVFGRCSQFHWSQWMGSSRLFTDSLLISRVTKGVRGIAKIKSSYIVAVGAAVSTISMIFSTPFRHTVWKAVWQRTVADNGSSPRTFRRHGMLIIKTTAQRRKEVGNYEWWNVVRWSSGGWDVARRRNLFLIFA